MKQNHSLDDSVTILLMNRSLRLIRTNILPGADTSSISLSLSLCLSLEKRHVSPNARNTILRMSSKTRFPHPKNKYN